MTEEQRIKRIWKNVSPSCNIVEVDNELYAYYDKDWNGKYYQDCLKLSEDETGHVISSGYYNLTPIYGGDTFDTSDYYPVIGYKVERDLS